MLKLLDFLQILAGSECHYLVLMGFEWVLKCQPNVFLFWFYILIWFWHIWPTVQSGCFNWHGSDWFRHGFRHGSQHQNWVSVYSFVVMVFGVSPAFGGPMKRAQTHNLATDFCTLMRARHALDVGYSLGSPSLVGNQKKLISSIINPMCEW